MFSLQAEATAQAAATKSRYRGVRKRSEVRYAAEIRDPSKKRRIWLGTFNSDIQAAHAYDQAARTIKGCKAKTNFPLSAYQIPKPVKRSAAYKTPEPLKEIHVPSWINTSMVAIADSRPPALTHAYLTKSFNVGTSPSPSLLQAMFPPELQRQQRLAALKMSNQPGRNETEGDGGVGGIHEGCKVSCSPCNCSDPSSSAVIESRDSPTMGGLDLNLPAPVEEDECDHSRKTLLLFK
ncbi:hypothetical protein SUGI_1176240 [Cryptomeria japonica]|uniref:ethylene-responsive transcription factor 4 n=1 Tax=Cryptomeria japonica TaxID=3369 RepID=UPI002414BA5D|nr:ethylene-responsive transcription factor 4 [Cryptomeria japonica]GLJ54759.1 hypothetical protein SUGI_1176240 [Cryptomeria japonica]